ncbi:hypothetical protein Tco_1032469 [Tanacetum coccineum]|uniref:Uncharacterized protein n=1 Tax=Tanacetum coccineum TaxID=301880 RepID=A0ABQ5GBY4_9ASTR
MNILESYKRYQEEEGKDYQCPEEASSFNVKEWEDIQARVEADEELAQRILSFDCLLSLDEQICPRFIFEFYKTLKLERDSNNNFSIQFVINNHHFSLSLVQFAELTYLPNQGICIYSDSWGLDELEKTLEQIEPYNLCFPALDDI